jgi:predicted RNase H-like nuclease (RuvC/YqgF family)
MTQRYTREQLFERNNVLVNKRDEEREKEEIERKIRKLKDNEEDMLIALKKFDDDMAMQINRQKREIERVKERIQDLKQEVRVEKSTIRHLILLPIMILIYGQIYN